MATKNVSVRMSSDGSGKVKADLSGLGDSGSASMERLAGTASLAVKAFIGFQGGRLIKNAIGNIADYARDTIDFAGALHETAEELGVTTEGLQRYEYAASQVGIEQEKLEAVVSKVNLEIGQALKGNKDAAKGFDDLGISLLDAEGKTRGTGAAFNDLIDRLGAIENPAERAAAAATLVGDKLGRYAGKLAAEGGAAFRGYGDEAERLGMILSDDVAKNADDVGDALRNLGGVVGSQARSIVVELAPSVETIRGWTVAVAGYFDHVFDGIRLVAGVAPDLEETIDRITKAHDAVAQAQKALDEFDNERARIAREQPGASLSFQLTEADVRSDLRDALFEAEQERDKLLAHQQELIAAMERGGTAPGAGLTPPDDADILERERQIARDVAALEGLRLALDPATAANERFAESMRLIGASDLPNKLDLMLTATLEWSAALEAADKDGAAAAERTKEMAAAFGQVERELDTAKAALDDYVKRLDTLDQALANGTISLERHGELVGHAGAAYAASFGPAQGFIANTTAAVEEQEDKFEGLIQAVEGFGRRSARVFADVLLGIDDANDSIGRLLQTLASDIVEQLIYDSITGPLARAAGAEIGSLFGFAEGGRVPGSGGPRSDSVLARLSPGEFVVNAGATQRFLPLLDRINAVRGYADGGRVGASGWGGDVSVTVIDQRGAGAAPVQVRQRRGSDGRREIEIVVRDMIDKLIGEGRLDRTMSSNYGLSRAPVMRG